MPKIFIDSLTIENFGPYYSQHEFNFRCDEQRTGTLIGGKNGSGKTHLLRALYIAAAGEAGINDVKKAESGSDATKFVFEQSLNRRARAEGEDTIRLKIVISKRLQGGAGASTLELTREIRFRPNSPPVFSSIARESSGDGREIRDEQVIQELRDSYLPRHLARFFFFDAERSQSINLNNIDMIEGISRVLGHWTYAELEKHLQSLIATAIPNRFGKGGEAEHKLASLNADIQKCEGDLRAYRNEKEELILEISNIVSEIQNVEDELKTVGTVDPNEIEKARRRQEEIQESRINLKQVLTSAWESALPMALLGNFRRELYEYLESEERRRDWDGRRSSVEPKIPQIKQDVFNDVPDEFELTGDTKEFYTERLVKALNSLFHPPPEGMSDRVFVTERNEISAQIRLRLSSSTKELQNLADICKDLEDKDTELGALNHSLSQMQLDPDAQKRGNALRESRGQLLEQKGNAERKLADIETRVPAIEAQIQELKRQESVQSQVVEKISKGRSLSNLALKYKEVSAEVKSLAAKQYREKISEIISDLWLEIAERNVEFSGLEFDQHWKCWLVKKTGDTKIAWEDFNASAGQKQVRLLAFIEALRRLATHSPPLVVDTPLGRLDKEVRHNVLTRLYLTSSQSIILSTNGEIDPTGPLFDEISDRLYQVYTLHPDGNSESSDYSVRVSEDYFGREL